MRRRSGGNGISQNEPVTQEKPEEKGVLRFNATDFGCEGENLIAWGRAECSLGGRMEQKYKALMRRVKRYLLLEKRKKSVVGRYVKSEIFTDEYWGWNRSSVTAGATWGAVCAILPVPMQTLWGIACCLWKKGNIPVAVLMAWISPPGFLVVAVPFQWWLGWWILTALGFPGSGATWEMMENAIKTASFAHLDGLRYWMVGAEFCLGLFLSCVAIFALAWLLVQVIWLLGGFPSRPEDSESSEKEG